MKVRLPDTVSSAQDLASLTNEVRDYAKWFAHNAIKERVHAKNATPPPALSPGALELVRSAGSNKLLSSQSLDQLIAGLEDAKNSADSVTITLAAPATSSVKQSLVKACRENIADNTLVTFKFNSGLCGGMVIHYGSHVFDWSFRRQILENRTHFTEVLRRV